MIRSACVRFSFFVVVLLTPLMVAAQQRDSYVLEPQADRMYMIEQSAGQLHCRIASEDETALMQPRDESMKRIYPTAKMQSNAGAFHIVLEGTAQLDTYPAAKAAFIKAAQIWESRINNPLTVTIQVDFGPTRFGTPYPNPNILGSTQSRQYYVNYTPARSAVAARADNAAETSLYAKLPSGSTVPTDLGAASRVLGSSIQLLTLGFTLPADRALPSVGFNSAFAFDLDATNGIDAGKYDFEAVTVHEIGHALGFGSSTGDTELTPPATEVAPTIWDLFRFRPGVTINTFQTANRPMASGGTHVHFAGGASLQMSTGRADNTGGDEQQSSHWKDNTNGNPFIGLMDPTIPSGTHIELSANDLAAFEVMGYTIVAPNASAPAAPTNLTATATSSSVIRLNWTDNSSDETEFRIEQRVGSSFVDLGSASANATTINVTGFSAGQTGTFRIRARNASGDSAYSNEASATTPGAPGACTPNANTVCLLSDRFRVSIDYINAFVNPPQPGKFIGEKLVAGVQNPDVATFGISGAKAIEVVVRIQDTRPFGLTRFDVYYGGLTDLQYTVTVTDTQTGTTRAYTNAAGNVGGGVDRTSFTGLLGSDNITSGGYDSFPAGITLEPVDTPVEATARLPLTVAEAKMLRADAQDALVAHAEGMTITPHAAGGGGACSEVEPNGTTAQANALTLGEPCSGTATLSDTGSVVITFDGGGTDDIEDLFKITLASPTKLNVTMSFTNTLADLDLYVFTVSGTTVDIKGYSNGSSTTETAVTDTLPAGTYYVGISTFAGDSNYTVTAAAVGAPAAPTNLTATAISSSQIQLAWTDNANNETGYVVEGAVGNSGFSQIDPVQPANTTGGTVTISNPVAGTTFSFRVKARNASGDSAYSNIASATLPTSGPQVCTASSTVACLLDGRFRVSIAYINAFVNPPQPGNFLGAKLVAGSQNPDVATFGISSAQAIEVVVRVQDTRPFGLNRFDIYYGGLTDLEYTVSVTDVVKGVSKTYTNAPGNVGGGVDRTTFTAN